jgi:hypothetical protein
MNKQLKNNAFSVLLIRLKTAKWSSLLASTMERCNNNIYTLNCMSKKRICKNCGEEIRDDFSDDSNPTEFCSEQCGVEYQMEHNRK